MDSSIADNLRALREHISEACAKFNRDTREITIIGVTKTHPAQTIREAVAAGLREIGESRIQESEPKLRELGPIARYHLIGHLQTNKVRKAVELFDVVQSVDSLHLAQEISRRAGEIGRTIECLLEVNSSGEEQKYGISFEQVDELLAQVMTLPNIKLTGLMTVGPLADDESTVRRAFARCHQAFVAGQKLVGAQFVNLSMGMSDDFSLAIAEGSTMIRVGTALFGSRPA